MSGERTHERIQFTDSWADICVKLCDGNCGALDACAMLLERGDRFNMASPLGLLQAFLALDSAAIFGPKLWLLWNDLCGRDTLKMLAACRALDAGLLSATRLHLEIEDVKRGKGAIDHAALLDQLRKRWPDFGREK